MVTVDLTITAVTTEGCIGLYRDADFSPLSNDMMIINTATKDQRNARSPNIDGISSHTILKSIGISLKR